MLQEYMNIKVHLNNIVISKFRVQYAMTYRYEIVKQIIQSKFYR